jgi:hypothetical protein
MRVQGDVAHKHVARVAGCLDALVDQSFDVLTHLKFDAFEFISSPRSLETQLMHGQRTQCLDLKVHVIDDEQEQGTLIVVSVELAR